MGIEGPKKPYGLLPAPRAEPELSVGSQEIPEGPRGLVIETLDVTLDAQGYYDDFMEICVLDGHRPTPRLKNFVERMAQHLFPTNLAIFGGALIVLGKRDVKVSNPDERMACLVARAPEAEAFTRNYLGTLAPVDRMALLKELEDVKNNETRKRIARLHPSIDVRAALTRPKPVVVTPFHPKLDPLLDQVVDSNFGAQFTDRPELTWPRTEADWATLAHDFHRLWELTGEGSN